MQTEDASYELRSNTFYNMHKFIKPNHFINIIYMYNKIMIIINNFYTTYKNTYNIDVINVQLYSLVR